MRVLPAAIALAVLAGLAETAPAQSLGELAAKEKQKRQGKPAPKVITETELSRTGKRGTVSMTGEAPAEGDAAAATEGTPAEGAAPAEGAGASSAGAGANPAAKPGPREKTEDEVRSERRAEWQKSFDVAREKVRVHTLNVSTIQRDLNDITGGVYTERRTQVQKMLDTEKAALAAAQADFDRLDEEGRRNGWPRG